MNEDMELTAAAKTWLNLMWRSIEDKIRATVGHHHWIHEPGGPDQIVLPVSALADVNAPSPSDGDALVYNATDKLWVPGTVASTGGTGLAFFEATGTISAGTIPGPTNATGDTLTVLRVIVASDGEVGGLVTAGGSFSFAAGGDTLDADDLDYEWTDGSALSMTISSVGIDATWLTATVVFVRA